jgi:hypothetical protein
MPHQETNPNRHTDGLTRLYTALKERSVTPSEDAWSRLAVRLDQTQKSDRKKRVPIPLWTWSAAAALVIGLIFWPKTVLETTNTVLPMDQLPSTNQFVAPQQNVSSEPINSEIVVIEPSRTSQKRQNKSIATNSDPITTLSVTEQAQENITVSNQLELAVNLVDKRALAAEVEAELMIERAINQRKLLTTPEEKVDPYGLWLEVEESIQPQRYLPIIDLLKTGYASVKTAVVLQIK